MVNYALRLEEKSYQKVKSIAKKQARSVNKQIEFIITQFLADYERVNGKIETTEED